MAILHKEFTTDYNDITKIQDIPGTDKTIADYIEKYGHCSYDSLIADNDNWQVFYHLSELRTGLFSWYDFKEKSEVLEIGAGFGALTGVLCKKCSHVTATDRSAFRADSIVKRYSDVINLDVYAGDIESLQFNKKFDYIILVGVLELQGNGTSNLGIYADYMKHLKGMLKTDGKILIAVENRYGVKYFCGAVEPHTNRAFDGINLYPKGTVGYSFSRQELKQILKEAGFGCHRFYYPLPDYKLPQLIYTDEYLPEKNLKERLIPYNKRNDTLIASEQELYNDIIENGVFPFFANSFLVECSVSESDLIHINYAAISTDRGKKSSFITAIHQGGKVRKTPVYPEGKENAKQLYNHIIDLKNHGIPVVEHIWHGDSLEMNYIEAPTLSNYIKDIMQRNIDEFVQIIDKIYEMILLSSEEIPKDQNDLVHRLTGDELELKKAESLEWGPILKKAYIELIPLNCFYAKENNKFLYFDQEFVRGNYPAKYVLFRAIHYIYCFTPNAEKLYAQIKLRERYGFGDTWDFYMKEEQCFLDEVRNQKQYRQFYKWAAIDPQRIQDNATRLESEEEQVANYKVSNKMKKIWKVELDILDRLDILCKKHGIQYFVLHGTLLGAVRHKGFIPWDDDLDIGMFREDYERFLKAATEELEFPLSLQTPRDEKDRFFGGGARIRNSETTGIEAKEIGHEGNSGIWIDILPLDICTEDEKKYQKKQVKIRRYHRLLYAKIYGRDCKEFMDMTPFKWKGYQLLSLFMRHEVLCNRLDKAMKLYSGEDSDYVSAFSGYYKHRRLNRSDFNDIIPLEFEHRKVPAPCGYKNYLFMTMGRDYMKYPPQEERKPKHTGIFDPEKSYLEYQKILNHLFDNLKNKKIILFGAGMMFEDYMKKYGTKYKPAFIVDNDETKWGRTRMGIEIKSPQEILKIPEEKRKLILCSYYYVEIEEQLKQMGIDNYQVYIQETAWILNSENSRKE